jgi:hypothetical protein
MSQYMDNDEAYVDYLIDKDFPDAGELGVKPEKTYTCKFCGKGGFYWVDTGTGWKLYERSDGNDTPHSCLRPKVKPLTEPKESVIMVEDSNPFGEVRLETHYKGCWREHGRCATKKLEELDILLNMCKNVVSKKEMKRVLDL